MLILQISIFCQIKDINSTNISPLVLYHCSESEWGEQEKSGLRVERCGVGGGSEAG